ncbi:MAG: hypothetical protein ACYCUM_02405 [Solirubrobacteraceae bacterium]
MSLGKRAVGVLVLTIGLGFAAAALAYFTGSGSGTGTAKVATATATVGISGVTTGELYPGGTAGAVAIKLKNTGAQPTYVDQVTLASITPDAAHSGCKTTLTGSPPPFEMAAVEVKRELKAAEEYEVHGSLEMNDTGESQNSCQGAELALSFTSD